MAMETKITAKPTLAEFLHTRYEERKRDKRRNERVNYSQNDFAEDIGMIGQTLSRYMKGDKSMTLDQAILLLRFFGPDTFTDGTEETSVLDHFEFSDKGLDRDTAEIIAGMPRLNREQKQLVVRFVNGKARNDEEPGLGNLLAGA